VISPTASDVATSLLVFLLELSSTHDMDANSRDTVQKVGYSMGHSHTCGMAAFPHALLLGQTQTPEESILSPRSAIVVFGVMKQCKALALRGDAMLVAAMNAYKTTKNKVDAVDTLRAILAGSSSAN
jgi:hypothetical protein